MHPHAPLRAPRPRPASPIGRDGFFIVELVIALSIAMILARLAMPAYEGARIRSAAADAAAELRTVRAAAVRYHDDVGAWPEDAEPGVVPPGLAPYLPSGFSFERDRYRLDWENWPLLEGTPGRSGAASLPGISVHTDDHAFGRALVELLGSEALKWSVGETYTFALDRL